MTCARYYIHDKVVRHTCTGSGAVASVDLALEEPLRRSARYAFRVVAINGAVSPAWNLWRIRVATEVAEAPWSVAEWAVALRFDNPRATVLVLVSG